MMRYDEALLTDPTRDVWTRAELRKAIPIGVTPLNRVLSRAGVRYAKRGPGDYVYDRGDVLAALQAARGPS